MLEMLSDVGQQWGGARPKAVYEAPLLTNLKLSEIRGEHPLVHALREESCGYLRERPIGVLSEAGLIELAWHFPLHAVRKQQHYLCIGGLSTFRLLKADASQDAIIPVLVHARLGEEQIRDCVRLDLILAPALFAIHHKDKRALGHAWKQLRNTRQFQRVLRRSTRNALSLLLGCDSRTLEHEK